MVLKENGITDKDVIGDLLQSMDVNQDFVCGDNNYVWFYSIAKQFRPHVIAEFGTRFGYSMKAFVSGAGWKPEEYYLYSVDNDYDGLNSRPIFENYFKNMGVKNLVLINEDSSNVWSLPCVADLCLVDAKHTIAGCFQECLVGYTALRVGGVLVIDDVNYDEPQEGAEKFAESFGLKLTYLPSLRGIFLVEKTSPSPAQFPIYS